MATINADMRQRRGVDFQWASSTRVTKAGEFLINTDNNKVKLGDDVNVFSNVPYLAGILQEDISGNVVWNHDGGSITNSTVDQLHIFSGGNVRNSSLTHYRVIVDNNNDNIGTFSVGKGDLTEIEANYVELFSVDNNGNLVNSGTINTATISGGIWTQVKSDNVDQALLDIEDLKEIKFESSSGLNYSFGDLTQDFSNSTILLTFTRGASNNVITLPDPTDTFWVGKKIVIQVIGSGSGNVTVLGPSSENIELTEGSTVTSMVWNGAGTLILSPDGAGFKVLNTGVWDEAELSDYTVSRSTNGEMEIRGFFEEVSVSSSSTTQGGTTLYRDNSTLTSEVYPITFVGDPPVCSLTFKTESAGVGIYYGAVSFDTNNTQYIIIPWAFEEFDEFTYGITAVGKWV